MRGDLTAFLSNLMEDEFDNACSIYTRVFIDVLTDEIIVPGYIVKTRYFEEPRIQKMPSDKSKNAVYYMYHMKYGKSLFEIDSDSELKRFDRLVAYSKLFAKKQQTCRICGNSIQMKESKKKQKFLYFCDRCKKWYTLNELYPTNMKEK